MVALAACRAEEPPSELPVPDASGRWSAVQLEPFDAQRVVSLGTPVKVVALWATWCEPCIEEMPELDAFQSAHPEVVVIGLTTDALDDNEAVQAVFDRLRPRYAQGRLRGGEGRFLEHLGLRWDGMLPKTVVLGPGETPARVLRPPVSQESLEAALAPYLSR